MKKLLFSLSASILVLGFLSLAPDVLPQGGVTPVAQAGAGDILDILDRLDQTFVLDVAIDARTWRLDTSLSPDHDQNPFDPFDVNKLIQVKRGHAFIVDGKVYPGGTIPPGGDFNNPSTFGPDSPGSVGRWTCRGAFNFDFTEIAGGAAPHVFTTQTFQFNDNDALWTDGAEGGMTTVRTVLGGTGRFSGVRGQVTQEPIGVNSAGSGRLFNLRMTFKLKKESN